MNFKMEIRTQNCAKRLATSNRRFGLKNQCNTCRKKESGMVLLSVLAVTIVLSLLIAAASTMISKRITLATQAKQQLHQKMLAYQTRDELIYLLSTQRATRAGISQGIKAEGLELQDGHWVSYYTGDELRVDGYTYKASNDFAEIEYEIQASNGLIPINASSQFWLKSWLIAQNVDYFDSIKYAESLADYADPDDWIRPAGAERRTYQLNDLPAPSNFLLQNCSEIHNVYSWHNEAELTRSLVNHCSIRRSNGLNLNAAPAALLTQLWPEKANNVIKKRQHGQWLLDSSEATIALGNLSGISEEYLEFIPSSNYTISLKIEHLKISDNIDIGRGNQVPFSIRPQK